MTATLPNLQPSEDLVREIYDVAGSRVEVGAPAGDLHAAVSAVLRGFPLAASGAGSTLPRHDLIAAADGTWQVAVDGKVISTSPALIDAISALEWSLVTRAVESRSGLFHLHAAALAVPAGNEAIAIVGRSGAGKSTLALALMRHDFLPYSDDVVLMQPDTLDVQPFHRSFHVSPDTWRLLGESNATEKPGVALTERFHLPLQWAATPAPIRWIVFLERTGAEGAQVLPVQPSQAATIILQETLTLERAPRVALDAVARLTREAQCFRLISDGLPSSVQKVRQLVGT